MFVLSIDTLTLLKIYDVAKKTIDNSLKYISVPVSSQSEKIALSPSISNTITNRSKTVKLLHKIIVKDVHKIMISSYKVNKRSI